MGSNASVAAAAASVNYDLKTGIDQWLFENQMMPHPGKSEKMKIGSLPALRSSVNIDICLNNCKLNNVDVVKYLGVYIDSALTWSNQLSSICVKVYQASFVK